MTLIIPHSAYIYSIFVGQPKTMLNRCMYLEFDPVYAQRITQMQGLGDWWKQQAIERSEKLQAHWTATIKDQA